MENETRISDAKQAVQMFWSNRSCLPDSDSVNEAIELIRDIAGDAKAQGRKITGDEWIAMAEQVDDACVDECLPRLFEIEGA